MRSAFLFAIVLTSSAALAASVPSHRGSSPASSPLSEGKSGELVMSFEAMYGVDGPFVGDSFLMRGIPGDELPWEVAEARGRLDAEGHLTIRVRGLVFKDEPSVPAALRGINDEAQFRAVVSCLSETADESTVTTVNVVTAGFPATTSGNSTIRTTVALPKPCVAPVIMILAGSENKWFALSGVETPAAD